MSAFITHHQLTHYKSIEEPNYPHVYKNSANGGNILSTMGSRYMLPLGTTKDHFDVGCILLLAILSNITSRTTTKSLYLPQNLFHQRFMNASSKLEKWTLSVNDLLRCASLAIDYNCNSNLLSGLRKAQ